MSDARSTIAKQRKTLKLVRRYTFLAAAVGLVYIVTRFQFTELSESRCSPLTRFAPGDRLVVDSRPGAVSEGDAVLVMTRGGTEHLCRIDRVREDGHLWCNSDNQDCPGFTSEDAGWVDPRAVTGRVLMSWEH